MATAQTAREPTNWSLARLGTLAIHSKGSLIMEKIQTKKGSSLDGEMRGAAFF